MLSLQRENTSLFKKLFRKVIELCLAFIGLFSNDPNRRDDVHYRTDELRTRRYGGLTIEENFYSSTFHTAFQSCTKARAHQSKRNFWCGKVEDGDLVTEIKRNGFGDLFETTLYDLLERKKSHERHRQIGSPLSTDQLLSILLYTNYGTLCSAFRKDEIQFSMQDVTVDSDCIPKQKWPIFGRVLNSALCCLNKYDRANRPTTVYHGLCGIQIDPKEFRNSGYEAYRTKMNPFFKYGTFISTTTDRDVAVMFGTSTAAVPTPGSVFTIDTTPDEHGNELIIADIGWVSRYEDEKEYLIARLAQFGVNELQFDEINNIHMAKVSVEFFTHRGQKCYSHEHNESGCSCVIPIIPRPDWMPPPEHGKL